MAASVLSNITLANSTVGIVGTLNATGTTIDVGTGSKLGDVVIGIAYPGYGGSSAGITGGTIHDAGDGLQIEGNVTLTDVTYQGAMTIASPYSTVTVSDLTLLDKSGEHAGTLVLSGAQSVLEIASNTMLNNATIDIGSSIIRQGGTTLDAPTIETALADGPPILGASVVVDQTAKYAGLGGTALGFTTTTDATINATFNGGQMLLDGTTFTNGGTLNVGAGEIVTSAAGSFTNEGAVSISAGGTLSLNLLNYYQTLPDSETSFENTGQISLTGGTIAEQTGKGIPPVPLRNDATASISGVGILATEIANYGTISAIGGELTISQAVSGGGALDIGASATLSLLSAVSSGQIATFGGTDGVLGLSGKTFLGEIGGFASGDTIDLLKLAATSAEFEGSSIVVTLTQGGTISLATTEPLSGSLTVTGDGHGGSLIAFAGDVAHAATVPDISTAYAQPAFEPQWHQAIWDAMLHHFGY